APGSRCPAPRRVASTPCRGPRALRRTILPGQRASARVAGARAAQPADRAASNCRIRPWHHRCVTSSGVEHLARTAYEAHRGAHPADLLPWEETTEQQQQAWRVAVSAVAAQTGTTLIEKASPTRSLVIQAGDKRHTFQAGFTAGRQGNLAISDGFASGHHCRF